jgi:hypothetical protein
MSTVPEIARPSQLWKQLSAERRTQAAEAFWRDEHARAEQAEAIAMIAQRIKFRAKSVVALPVAKKAHYLTSLAAVSEMLAARLLVAFHLECQRPMMGSFLDALGVAHENGLIADEQMQAPEAEMLEKAVEALATAYPADDVRTYLTTLIWQDPDTWGGLTKHPRVTLAAPAV